MAHFTFSIWKIIDQKAEIKIEWKFYNLFSKIRYWESFKIEIVQVLGTLINDVTLVGGILWTQDISANQKGGGVKNV